MDKKATIRNIAKSLNVAISTVSSVLNNKSEERRISAATQNKILSYAKKVGYKPDIIARSLRMGKTKVIAMLVEDIANSFYATLTKLIENELSLYGYMLICVSTENDLKKSRSLIQNLIERKVDGYIMAPIPELGHEIKEIIHAGMPVVVFDSYLPNSVADSVCIDNFAGIYKASMHLIRNGFKHIAMVTIESELCHLQDRFRGYESALSDNDLKIYLLKIDIKLPNYLKVGRIKEFLLTNHQIDAIIFSTNYLTISGLAAISTLDKNVAENIAVISFDDNPYFAVSTPTITVIAQPMERYSKVITSMLIEKLENRVAMDRSRREVIRTTLKIRNSTRLRRHLNDSS